MNTLLVSGLVAAGMLGTGLAGQALVSAPDEDAPDTMPPSHVALPDQANVPEGIPPAARTGKEERETPDEGARPPKPEGQPASEEGQQRRDAALAFVGSMQGWTACIAEAAPAHDERAGEFDPEAACGPKPAPPAANEAEDTGRPSEVPPAGTGQEGRDMAEQAQQGDPPERDAVEPADRRGGSGGAGLPEGAGRPDGAGPPSGRR